ncbi:TonB-dependent receptor domain-containing protein, partial [Salinibacter sp.]|uniref:TonB-dependent receptor domain-containing protein n=1 Tax=Salinibacter sp. TaxID=2065818 RepID=UPI0021E7DAF5
PGATVQIVDEGSGAASDAEGQYRITGVPAGEQTLRVSFVGFRATERTVNVPAGGTVRVNFELQPEARELEEVVVTGQGSGVERERLSTTAQTVSGDELEAVPTNRLEGALQSQLDNTQIRLGSGQPGSSAQIRSRGPVSADGVTTPVIYVDGVRVDNRVTGSPLDLETGGARTSSIADIPTGNIERVEFVKGGAATTLYGSDAANGVLQIFTKDGSGVENNQLNFETRLGAEYGTDDFFRFDRTGELIFENPAFTQEYKLSGAGSAGGLNYSFSGKMYENNAARINNENIRYNLNTKVSATPLEDLQYTGSLKFVHDRYDRAIEANFTSTLLRFETGRLLGQQIDSLDAETFNSVKDSLQRGDELYQNETRIRRFQTSQTLRYNPIQSLNVRLQGGVDYRVENTKRRSTNQYQRQIGALPTEGGLTDFTRDFLGLTLSGNANHEASWRFLDFKTDVGFQIFRDETKIVRINGDDLPDGSQTINSAGETTASDFIEQLAQWGIYAKENIGFGDRFFLDLGIRGDENSAFGEEIGTEWYPSIGASYILTEEPFIEDAIPTGVISNLKLRGSYGEAGNFPTPFANQRLINAGAFLGALSYQFAEPGDPNLGPERVETWEVGANIGLFSDRVTFQVTRYNETTTDAIFDAPFSPSTGLANQERNIGEIENKGWELSSDFAILEQPEYSLNLSASLNTLDNEVVDNGPAPEFFNGGFTFLGSFVGEGNPVGYLRGDQPQYNEDGEITGFERNAFLGDPNPDQFGSISLSGRYKGLSVRATADYQLGAQGVATNDVLRTLSGFPDEGRFPNPNNLDVAPAVQQLAAGEVSFFDLAGAWVEDTNYLKVRTISLNYRLPESLLPRRVRSLRVGASARNPFNFVESGFDPEVTGSESAAGTVGGVFGYRTISPPRRFTFTLNIGI